MNDQKVTSNEYFSTTEENKSCFAQPKPCTMGKESTLSGNIQREGLPPLEKLKVSAVCTANGVKSLQEQPLAKDVAPAKDATDQSGSTEKTQPVEGLEESGPCQPGGKDDTTGTEEKEKDVEVVTEAQPLKGNAETEPLGTEAKGQPLRTVDGNESPKIAVEMKTIGIAENIPPLETLRQLQPQETVGKDEQAQILETIPKENESPEILEGSQFVETADEQQLQETLGKDELSQILETIPKENETPEVLDRSQLVEIPVMNDFLHKTPDGPGNMEQTQPEGIVGSMEHPSGIVKTRANMDMVRKIHTNEQDQHIEGETGEKVETEMESEKVSEGAGTKEEETGEAVDLSAATQE
ncbi:PREDICTED: glutamate-rich protein 5 [Galeopterus variegatus]|uniref:Glutamate-rich protein 5 n=1 Tax=Galeopterus variegatus TaxID=482537 RepID=A0ABM0QYJ8_GALVR|nr:PREDICTED: glutamate-rich protein 5 [Galeopterus variegatus]